ncbi:bifunctional glycosyltransferase family 2 protein/CDP-glycerol:glycerophosphate glycerophosphotransferase [Streptomyces misionensis]|uniref:Bifunctional glycosyltransferase family 2 protein/CDP-glycerol:glycerophosphate glycerophosphotransferase n=1 Tax=Streptomyces misionensis TaxID=67331 RepID=A0A5C6JJJ6_9ACTN|nr:bifunctional glycosyltransferase family 2 protein/CDP-glycerol:glycerophosphate glycerophosphotransferase [Streptomyces misionensis]TWV41261.1 bifunctional glycosyltransferase family 2 protein/CDP-glycerol:glycerophosphate glycerophosphotransferase [Streptomyces misionensis]
MPRFSVIVPCHRVQAYLPECLDSVLAQSYRDIEVIAVDDRSPDGCGAILDEYAARDPRVRVLHLPENVGLGRARNAGLAHAGGDHLLFLDGDDTLTPGALRAVADRLAETGDPDVLGYDHVRTHGWGGTRRDAPAEVLAGAGPDTFTAAGYPRILDLPMVVGNKVYRREFVAAEGFEFPPGCHEDIPWTFPVMLSARRIAALDRICLNHRQRRQGGPLPATGREHFDVHGQYERVFAFLDARPRLAHWRPYLHRKMGEHCLGILAEPDRLPPADRPEFFRRTAELFRRLKPRGARVDGEVAVLEGTWAAYRLRRQAARAGHGAARLAESARQAAAGRARTGWACLHARRSPDPHLVVYSASGHRGLLGDPAAVYHAARRIAPQLRGVWVVRDAGTAALLPPDVERVLAGTRRCAEVMARAAFLVNDVPWPAAPAGRPGSVYIHTHQGTPLKYLGADLLDKPGARLGVDVPRLLRSADRWDHSLVAGRHSELVYERAYPCRFASARTGSPRNDVLVAGGPGDFRRRHGIPDDHTVVLYAPTRRDYRGDGHVDRIDVARFAADLGEGHTLVVRLHPSLAAGPARGMGLTEPARRGVVLDATDEPHLPDVLLAADALVTDYSSVMFDYANLDRPIALLADDWPAFRASRGAYIDITAEPPGHVAYSYRELARLFASGRWRDEESARLRAAFRSRYCEFEDGRAAERVVRTLLLGEPMPAGPAAGSADGRAGRAGVGVRAAGGAAAYSTTRSTSMLPRVALE